MYVESLNLVIIKHHVVYGNKLSESGVLAILADAWQIQGHPTDRFGGISVRKTCNQLKFSVREMSSRDFLINSFCFRRDKNDVLGTKKVS